MSSNGPQILRPTPRRPFDLNLTALTPSEPSSPPNGKSGNNSGADTPSFSRTRSILNLTSSTLFGIYSPAGYSNEREEASSPWGTGAQTPRERLSIDSNAPQFASRTQMPMHRRTSSQRTIQKPLPLQLLNLTFRVSLLFVLGMGYGLLVTHLHNDRQVAPFQVEGLIKPSYNWAYIVLWGFAGVGLGSLLPYVDTLWEETPPTSDLVASGKERQGTPEQDEDGSLSSGSGLAADWNPVVRSIGAFVGIAFAIRKLPWASTLQVSLTLFLVNPVLWYLIDRSKPGFLLSASAGLVGTTVLLALNPEMMPAPATSPTYVDRNTTSVPQLTHFLGGLVAKETIECGTWIISVLFCSTVCFGNIGRRLALKSGGNMRRRDSIR